MTEEQTVRKQYAGGVDSYFVADIRNIFGNCRESVNSQKDFG